MSSQKLSAFTQNTVLKMVASACLLLAGHLVCSQTPGMFTSETALIHINEEANLFIGVDASLSGKIENEGTVELSADVNFNQNIEVGDLKFSGAEEQLISGREIIVHDLSLEKDNEVRLLADSVEVTGNLKLINGYLNTADSKLTVSAGDISGGSNDSFISGKLYRQSTGLPLSFPMGINGLFNSLELSALPASSIAAVELRRPENDFIVAGDSLVGVAKEAEWVLSYSGVETTAKVNINFDGLDLLSASDDNPIKAFSYSPVIATVPTGDDEYRHLGTSGLMDTDSISFGTISHLRPLILTDGSVNALSIGRMPLSKGVVFYLPNVFSPNSMESNNQVFRPFIEGTVVKSVQMRVWDSFNREVYHVAEENPVIEDIGWNGLRSGSLAEEGVYFHSVKLVTDSGVFEKSGSLFLIL